MLLHSSPERYLALPTNTTDVLVCRIRRTETQVCNQNFSAALKGAHTMLVLEVRALGLEEFRQAFQALKEYSPSL